MFNIKLICIVIVGLFFSLSSQLNADAVFQDKKSDFPDLERFLSGKKLAKYSSYTSSYGGGGTYSSTVIYINPDHTFLYRYESGSSSEYFSSSNNDEVRGYWEIISYNGDPYVHIIDEDGGEGYRSIKVVGVTVYLDGEKYTIEN